MSKKLLFTDKDNLISTLLYNVLKRNDWKQDFENVKDDIIMKIIDLEGGRYIKDYLEHENKEFEDEKTREYIENKTEYNSKYGFMKPQLYGLEFTYDLFKYFAKKI